MQLKDVLEAAEGLAVFSFLSKVQKPPATPQARGHDDNQEEDTSRAGLWGHEQQQKPRLWLGKENKIAPSACARLHANSTLHLYDVAFSKAS